MKKMCGGDCVKIQIWKGVRKIFAIFSNKYMVKDCEGRACVDGQTNTDTDLAKSGE